MEITLDIETFSRQDLKKGGMAKYAEHESTDILCACWAFDDGPVSGWVPEADLEFLKELLALYPFGALHGGPEVPKELIVSIAQRRDEVHAWNNAFERSVLAGPAGRRYGFPKIELSQAYCSMVNSRIHGLPGALEDAANAVNASTKKRTSGVNAMRYLCKPRKDGTRPTLKEERERFLLLVPYCADDVAAERAVDNIVPRMTDSELRIYRELDQLMNDRGWEVDLEAVDNMEMLIRAYKIELDKLCRSITGIKPSRPGPLADWIRSHGFPGLENLQADTVRKALLKELPEDVKRVLKIYSTFNMKAPAKYQAMRLAACADNRLRHLFMMYGAGTGRWSSVIVQLQNLFRSVISDPEAAIEIAKEWDLEYLKEMFAGVDAMKVIASAVRSVLIAGKGKHLIFPDYAGVEARWNAWMFDEQWKLAAFRSQDAGTGPSSYCVTYGFCFNEDPNFDTSTKEGSFKKQLGKVLDLSMGYEGGVGAFVKMAGTYRIDLKDMVARVFPTLPPDVLDEAVYSYQWAVEQGRTYDLPERIWVTCEALKILWRRKHPKIVTGWTQLKEASLAAVGSPGLVVPIPNKRVAFKVEGDFLKMRLPSGRCLWYYMPRIKTPKRKAKQHDGTTKLIDGRPELHYLGMNTVTRQWGPTSTYGGKTCENETQGGCRDLLIECKYEMIQMGDIELIGSIHDQPVGKVDEGWDREEELVARMCKDRVWHHGLPLAVEMHRGYRFRK